MSTNAMHEYVHQNHMSLIHYQTVIPQKIHMSDIIQTVKISFNYLEIFFK